VGAYAIFLPKREIFKTYSVQTKLFCEKFRSGHVQHLGNANRFCKLKHVEYENFSFKEFCDEHNIRFEPTHRQALRNLEAGYKSAAKYDRPQPAYERKAFGVACDWLRKHFRPYVSGARILDQDTVINDLDRGTAAGYPWNLIFHSKGEMFDAGFLAPIIWYWNLIGLIPYQVPIRLALSQCYHPIWTNTEKKEIREIKKLIENKIRTFTASPTEFTVAANRMCLDFNNLFYSAGKTCSFVGKTKFFQGWHNLYLRLAKHPRGFEFDAGSFDASVFRDALLDQMEFRWESYPSYLQTPENRRRLTHIYGEIINSVIILESETGVADVILKNTGNPSGSVNTIVDNTMVLFRIFVYCWVRLCPPELFEGGYPFFSNNVEMALNGDDNTLTVSSLVLPFYNAENIIIVARELGVELTTPDPNPRHPLELSFLSQTPVLEESFSSQWVLPAPDYGRVLSSLMYGSETQDIRWHLLRAAALHVDSWANVSLRRILMDYMKFVMRRYKHKLVGTINQIRIEDIFNMIQSDIWCYTLYTGLEGGVGTVKELPHKIFKLMSLVRSEGIGNLQAVFSPPLEKVKLESKNLPPIAPGVVGQPIKILVQRKRKRTGEPTVDGLVGVERNPGPFGDDFGDGFSPLVPPIVAAGAWGAAKNSLTNNGNVYSSVVDQFAKLNSQYSILDTVEDYNRWWNDLSPRKRTGNPYSDGLIGVESNPGPKQIKKLEKEIKKETKAIRKATKGGKKMARNVMKKHSGKLMNRYVQPTTLSTAPVAVGSVSRNNFHKIGKVDNCIADCTKVGAINVQGTCFSNIGIGTSTVAGDRNGLYLDGTIYTAGGGLAIAFNFQDFDDRVYALATTHQWYRFRSLTVEYVPLVGTTQVGQWALSVSDNYQPTTGSEPSTIRSLLTSAISAAGSPWVPNCLPTYRYNGAKVWSCPSTDQDTSNADLYEQFAFIGRFLNTVASGSEVETGRFQFHYSVDFFEPRGNRGSITAQNINISDLHLFLNNKIMNNLRYDKTSWRRPFVLALRNLANDIVVKYKMVDCDGKNEEEECASPFVMEQNPLTQSIHIPKNVVERLAASLTSR